jgi:Amt family ammonium transporter
MMSAASLAIVTLIWVAYGYSLALTRDEGGGLIGGFDAAGLDDQIADTGSALPESVFVAFQLMFAIITVALISGAIADRAKFSTWCVFVAIWVTVVYVPVAHWVFHFGDDRAGDGTLVDPGWIVDYGVLDFAGGTAVHINSGAAALALVLIIGKRRGWRKDPMRPHNVPFVMLGAALLWFGWFGFNAGSAVAANNTAGVAFRRRPGRDRRSALRRRRRPARQAGRGRLRGHGLLVRHDPDHRLYPPQDDRLPGRRGGGDRGHRRQRAR